MKTTYKVPKSLRDKLQAAVDYLTEHPDRIYDAWGAPKTRKGGCLFRHVHPVRYTDLTRTAKNKNVYCGCLTQVKLGLDPAYTDKLTLEIRADDRLPDHPSTITVAHLPIFMEWMLRLAVEFRWKS